MAIPAGQDTSPPTARQTAAANYITYAEQRFETLVERKDKNDDMVFKAESRANAVIDSMGYTGSLINLLNNLFLWLFQVNLQCQVMWYVVAMTVMYLISLALPMYLAFIKLGAIFRSMAALKAREEYIDNAISALNDQVKLSETQLATTSAAEAKLSNKIQGFINVTTSIDVGEFKWNYYYYLSATAGYTVVYGVVLAGVAYSKFCGIKVKFIGDGGIQLIFPS